MDAERRRRDAQIETVAADFFVAQQAHDAIEAEMAAAIHKLQALGESSQRVQQLLGVSVGDIRRLRDAADPRVATPVTHR